MPSSSNRLITSINGRDRHHHYCCGDDYCNTDHNCCDAHCVGDALQEQGPYFYQVNDQGRYNVVGEELKAVGGDETDTVKDFFKNKNVREAIRSVKEKKEK